MPYYPLLLHCLTVGTILFMVVMLLARFGLFSPDRTGFWILLALTISLLINPTVTLIASDYSVYEHYTRGTVVNETLIYWVLLMSVMGIVAFYSSYLMTRPFNNQFENVPQSHVVLIVVLLLFMAVGWNAILRYRIAEDSQRALVNGKFSGNTTGWQTETHSFVIFPCLLLMAMKRYRIPGLILSLAYIAVRLYDRSDRFSLVAFLMAGFLYHMIKRGRRWPSALHCSLAAALLIFLVFRGHGRTESLNRSDLNLSKVVGTAFVNLGTGPDTSMLPTFYRESDLIEQNGFTYGTTFLQEIFLAPLPRAIFPWKDDVFAFIPGVRYRNEFLNTDVYFAKSTIICAFYGYGGVLGVLIGMAGLGWLMRKLDGLLKSETPVIPLVWAVMVLATIWMGSLGTVEWWYKVIMMFSLPMFTLLVVNRLVAGFVRRRVTPAA
ncbi:MAG: hypothetical protein WCT04_00715 [Planctomycetota bacterium]